MWVRMSSMVLYSTEKRQKIFTEHVTTVFHNPLPTFCSGAVIMSADIQSRMVCETGDREKLRGGGTNNGKLKVILKSNKEEGKVKIHIATMLNFQQHCGKLLFYMAQ